MKIAINESCEKTASFYREGIWVFNGYLADAFLSENEENSLEIWCIEENIDEFKKVYGTCFEKYPERISFLTPVFRKKKFYQVNWWRYIALSLKSIYLNILYLTTRKNKYRQKLQKTTHKKKYLFLVLYKSFQDLVPFSDADVAFSDFFSHNAMHFFKGPKVFMLHDLFTIPLADLFKETSPRIDIENENAVANLKQYANEGTYFVTSGNYIRREQLLKYIDNLPPERSRVIHFPPMIKKFATNALPTETEFRKKYNIRGRYIPYASQNRPNKNVILLLKALKRLKDKGIQISVVTTGDFHCIPKCADYIKNNGLEDYIREIGSLSETELSALYKYSSLAVIPTIIEGMGMSGQCLEALSFGTIPVIHAKSWGIKESLELNGLSMETADLNWVDLDDDKTLADKIEDVLANPVPHIEKQKHIAKAYGKRTWADVARDYMEVFKMLIKEEKNNV